MELVIPLMQFGSLERFQRIVFQILKGMLANKSERSSIPEL